VDQGQTLSSRRSDVVKLAIFDMDNTLYDWVGYFVPALNAMIKTAASLLSIHDADLRGQLKDVHSQRRNTEHPFALLETRVVKERFPNLTRAERFALMRPAFEAFDHEKKMRLSLYDGVSEALSIIRDSGCMVIGHTEAIIASVRSRTSLLGLDKYFSTIYAPQPPLEDHPDVDYIKEDTGVDFRAVFVNERKPNPNVLRRILNDHAVAAAASLYIGDSLTYDIPMAISCGVRAAWAKYGVITNQELFDNLWEVSHLNPLSSPPPRLEQLAVPDGVTVLEHVSDLLASYVFGT
jgi:phosphoglycolate phosphatase